MSHTSWAETLIEFHPPNEKIFQVMLFQNRIFFSRNIITASRGISQEGQHFCCAGRMFFVFRDEDPFHFQFCCSSCALFGTPVLLAVRKNVGGLFSRGQAASPPDSIAMLLTHTHKAEECYSRPTSPVGWLLLTSTLRNAAKGGDTSNTRTG